MIGEKIVHSAFGEGTITQVKDSLSKGQKYITVSFASCEKVFLFPDAFEKFLSAKNPQLQNAAEAAIFENKLEEKKKHELEALKKAAEKNAKKAVVSEKKAESSVYTVDSLIKGRYYGTNAKKIFSACADSLGWDKNEAKNFGWQTLNYSNIATPEGYSVWFLAHNNWTGTSTYGVKNKISETYMEQWWMEPQHSVATKRKRLIFAKKDNWYMFLGVFEFVGYERREFKDGINYYVERFDLVSENYPE